MKGDCVSVMAYEPRWCRIIGPWWGSTGCPCFDEQKQREIWSVSSTMSVNG